jgi:hypothetical protein
MGARPSRISVTWRELALGNRSRVGGGDTRRIALSFPRTRERLLALEARCSTQVARNPIHLAWMVNQAVG